MRAAWARRDAPPFHCPFGRTLTTRDGKSPSELPARQDSSQLHGRGDGYIVRRPPEHRSRVGEAWSPAHRWQTTDADPRPEPSRISQGATDQEQAALRAGANLLHAMPVASASGGRNGGRPAGDRVFGHPYRHLPQLQFHDVPTNQSGEVRFDSREIGHLISAGAFTHRREQ